MLLAAWAASVEMSILGTPPGMTLRASRRNGTEEADAATLAPLFEAAGASERFLSAMIARS